MGGSQSVSLEAIHEGLQECFTTYQEQYISIGIDDSLLQYSGTNSNAVLNDYSKELVSALKDQVPIYIEKVSTALAGASGVPHAVGMGALVISMILQIAFIATKGSQSNEESVPDMLRRIFAEEKASKVRDLMEEYMKRYRMNLRDDSLLLEESRRLEKSLSEQLTQLKNSMLLDGHMNSRALKHWANGAAFHVQMLIHIARLQKKNPLLFLTAKSAARSAIDTYSHDTSDLLKKLKEYKISNYQLSDMPTRVFGFLYIGCITEKSQLNDGPGLYKEYCDITILKTIDYIFSKHPHIIQLKNYFFDLNKNLADLCNQDGTFRIDYN